ncbi:hypothetical protein ESCO_004747 [Escovopsis weberi]|uniref:SGNH hydrolase-type esterase domain-containing protein n=1 Tax=Escovopsis weberi TaxID=150374 RepID=A0A0M8MU88_ESCWE|nr:hypothetical protein ESCO_004747 [Escovopsis weberi]
MAPPRLLRVLCFGDSLTQGFCDMGLTSHPYSQTLLARLEAAFPETVVEVVTNGVPGDVVSGPAWRRRLVNEFERRRYDWMIILGGTNDLASRIPVKVISQALTDIWDLALLKGSKVLALTVPECQVRVDWLDENRVSLNRHILNHQQKNFHAFDLRPKIPFYGISPDDRRLYWDDGLHLTPAGYDWMGGHVADAFVAVLSAAAAPQAPTFLQRAAKGRADDGVLEEEAGSPRVISRGYVVVRKRDLE